MSEFHMVQLALDGRRLAKWAHDRRLGGEDVGYAVHAIMCDAFGGLRLQPFSAEEKMGRVKVLGYGSAPASEMERAMADTAEPETMAVIMSVSSKVMPTEWTAGRRYRFRVRVAPTRQGHREDGRRREGDALSFEAPGADREETYRAWLASRLGEAAEIEHAAMTSFSVLRATRRSEVGGGKRPATAVGLPDAVFEGNLRVKEPAAFARLLGHGIGRHRSFGFGALMVRAA